VLATGVPVALTQLAARFAGAIGAPGAQRAGAGHRCWRRFAATDDYDAWLIAWGPESGLDAHMHEGSAGAFVVVRGALTERFWEHGADTSTTRRVRAHEAVYVPPTRIHAVHNHSRIEALSVHVYSPALG
jgi:mannose-6-phosphate isomerase-like protein (cupin superfamily)